MSAPETPGEIITREVSGWPDVATSGDRSGVLRFSVGRRQLGHVHGDWAAHFPLPRRLREQLMAEGRVERHPAARAAGSGWAARRIRSEEDVGDVIDLFRLQYERAREARSRQYER
ncbi:MAG: luciferase family protein [Gaiellaceae bacterium]